MNLLGALTFLPGFPFIRQFVNLPAEVHPLYLWIVSEFIFIFGLAYGYCAWRAHAPRLFVGVGAAGKLSFFVTLAGFWWVGDLPLIVVVGGSADLFFGCLFLIWLRQPHQTTT
ncbi:hypothetical protein [Larkinella ripae]